jgi:uncharacterized phage infection (PIP) family protein YhgE
MKTILALTAFCLVALLATGCGGSSASSKAKSQACDARSDIQKQVDTIKGLPLATSSIDTAKTAVTAISTDLKTIQDALPDVKGDLKSQLEQANSSFKSAVDSIAQSISTSSSVASVTAALTTAGTQLEAAYKAAFANVKC